jgi:tRNA(His) 5'-end guanylyltransferase
MKEYEIYSDIKVPKTSKVILRLDGRKFHTLTKNLNLEKPYDWKLAEAMVEVGKTILKEFSPYFIYTFSDELNIILSDIPFSGRIEKINSVFSSLASSSLTLNLLNSDLKVKLSPNFPVSFDSRIIPISNENLGKYFKWRQDEAFRNFVNSYGYWALREEFSKKETNEKLKGWKSSDIHQFLYENKGINLSKLPYWQRRGIAIYKNSKRIKGFNPKTKNEEYSYRNFIYVDKGLPLFDQEFFKMIT